MSARRADAIPRSLVGIRLAVKSAADRITISGMPIFSQVMPLRHELRPVYQIGTFVSKHSPVQETTGQEQTSDVIGDAEQQPHYTNGRVFSSVALNIDAKILFLLHSGGQIDDNCVDG